MHEHIARAVYYLQIHLLYASIVWFAAWVLTSILRGSATTKYWIWVATSLNFILPLGAAVDRLWASHLSWAAPLSLAGAVGVVISENETVGAVLGVAWLLGATLMLARLVLRVRVERRDAQAIAGRGAGDSGRSVLAHGIPVRFAGTRQTPAVDGVLRPHISLPDGIDRLLSEHELTAVLIHELTHARRRDNLLRLLHEVGLCALWFHPLVWITSSRLALYRELSCDESAIRSAHGGDLASALAKLANPEEAFLLQATASSFMSHRLDRLTAVEPQRTGLAANALMGTLFGAVLLAGVLGTVGHTACCFIARTQPHVAACNHGPRPGI
jgi:beta-lactamase regulating signal transducer with metallopeptidase domain